MYKTITAAAVSLFTVTMITTSCTSSAEKVKEKQEKVSEAQEDLTEAKKEYVLEVEEFKIENATKIAANEQGIMDYKTKLEKDKTATKEEFKNNIADLEKKNEDLRYKMNHYQASGEENWKTFKREFSHDLDALEKEFKNLTTSKKVNK